MQRSDIIQTVGREYLAEGFAATEGQEFSYVRAFKQAGKNIRDYQRSRKGNHVRPDLRFSNDRLVILVETKDYFSKWNTNQIYEQLQEYVRFEKELSDKRIVAILAETDGNQVWLWYGQSVIISDGNRHEEHTIRKFEEYEELCFGRVNDRIKVVDSIKNLNDLLHSNNIDEHLRSQFVGTCLLALKYNLVYKGVKETIDGNGNTLSPTSVVIEKIKETLTGLLSKDFSEDSDTDTDGQINKADKIATLSRHILEDQDIAGLPYPDLAQILEYIETNVLPYINDKNTAGQDLLNLFFTTFNKYVGKSDKNQAFTPDHICDFMSKAVGVNRNSRVLDPCCGSGAFLVRAMTDAMDDCDDDKERTNVMKHQIFGIEREDGAFGLASTNMLIHGDGNSNIVKDSMFNRGEWINGKNINIVLMNPPYNATKNQCDPEFVKTWDSKKKEDPSKGLHYVEWVARHVPTSCRMAVLLPLQCAIGNSSVLKRFKRKMLDNYTLDAVFSLPNEMFYPGASAVACCMVFDLSQRHEKAGRDTFFGYFKDDKFIKRKGLGRVEKTDEGGNSLWNRTEEHWLDLYRNRKAEPGLSVLKKVTAEDEWLAEAYMETDYTTLTENDFQQTLNDYLSYLVKEGKVYES